MISARINLLLGVSFLASTMTAWAAPPTAIDDVRTIAINSRLTVNVLANDFDEDADSLSVIDVSAGEFGSTQINDDGSILYVPNSDASGVDTFTYTIQDDSEAAETAIGTVTVNIVANAYSNLGLRSNYSSVADSFAAYCSNIRGLDDAEAGETRRAMVGICEGLELLAQQNPAAATNALEQISPEETLSMQRASLDSGRAQTRVVSQRIAHIKSGGPALAFNGHALSQHANGGGAGDDDSPWSALGLFVSAQIEQTEREQSDLENGYDSDGGSFTVGMDYRLNNNTVIGGALGVSNSELTYIDDAGKFDSDTNTAIVFGAWSFGAFSIESQLGYSRMNFDSERNIRYSDSLRNVDNTLTSETKGTQQLFNVQGQWEWNKDAWTLYPYLRINAQQNDIEGYEEFGGGGYAIGIEDQQATQITLSSGVQGTYALSYSWGVLIPTFELSLLSEVESDRDTAVGYFIFDTQRNNTFALGNDGGDSSFYQIGLGASAIMKRGVSSFFQYKQISGYEFFSSWQVQAGLRFEL